MKKILSQNHGGFRPKLYGLISTLLLLGSSWSMAFTGYSEEGSYGTDVFAASSETQIQLVDETGVPLANFAATYRSRCGGTWTYSDVPFTTDGNGFALLNTACASNNWDGNTTVTVNKTSRSQAVADNAIYQVARVNVNLTTCAGTPLQGGNVFQGSGTWTALGPTDASGRVSFYAFPGTTVVARMEYNYGRNDRGGIEVQFPTTNVDFTTTRVNIQGGTVQVGSGGWPTIAMPYEMLAGTYNFRVNGAQINGVEISGCTLNSAFIRLIDENSAPLANFEANYRSRCGGTWTYDSTPFTTNANGYALLNTTCPSNNWDGNVTVTVNKTSRQQALTDNNVFQVAKVNVNLTTCEGNPLEGGIVDQGSGSWTPRGTTGATGTISFYAFPGTDVVARMRYNYGSNTQSAVEVISPVTNINFVTTRFSLQGGTVQIGSGGWPTIPVPFELLAGTYNFRINGVQINNIEVSGCVFSKALLRVINEQGNPVAGATFRPACGGSWQTPIVGATDGSGNLLADVPECMTKIRATVGNSSQELSKAQLGTSNYTWTTQVLRVRLLDHSGNPIADQSGSLSQGGGTWIDLGKLDALGSVLVNSFPISSARYRMTYNCTSEIKDGFAVVSGSEIQVVDFQTGKVVGECATQYQGCGWTNFVSGMELMPGTRTYRYPSQTVTITAGSITTLNPCISVSPNPASDFIAISNYEGTIQIFNNKNILVYSGIIGAGPSNVDVSGFQPGLYVIRTSDGQAFKFIKL